MGFVRYRPDSLLPQLPPFAIRLLDQIPLPGPHLPLSSQPGMASIVRSTGLWPPRFISMMKELSILIAAHDPLARAGLSAALAAEPGFHVAAEVTPDEGLPEAVERVQPDVVLWDLGWEAADPAAELEPLGDLDPPVVVLLPDPEAVHAAWSQGARGVLHRQADGETLAAALAAAAQGLTVLAPAMAADINLSGQSMPQLEEDLTPRELEVLQLLAEGRTNKSIAQHLEISEHTVKFHINAILGKLSAQSRTEAVVLATRLGLIIL